ncbi:MAG TPA: hypothetical protein VEB43_17535 [Anaeromyxobacter sp.]|nr:hypothetical protein [Anaeromyxobacter sp.]
MAELPLSITPVVDINDAGDVLGFQCSDAICTESAPFLWNAVSGDVTYMDAGRWLTWTAALNDRGAALLQDSDHQYWLYAGGQARAILPDRRVERARLGNQGWIVGLLSTPTGPDAFLYEPDRDVLTIFGHGHYDVTSVNGAGDIVGHASGRAVLFEPDGGIVDLGLGDHSRPVAVTEGRLVHGYGGDSYDQTTGAYTPPFGFVHDLRTGETTRFDPPDGLGWEFVLDGNDRETLLRNALWSDGRASTLEALCGQPILGGVAINAAGQILVHFERADGRLGVGVLTPGE